MSEYRHLSRRQFLQLSGMAGATVALAACAAPSAEVEAPTQEAAPAQSAVAPEDIPALLGPDMPGSPDHPNGWTTVLPDLPEGLPPSPDREPIVISVTRRVDAQTSFVEGDDLENNPWARMIKKLFGVTFDVAWTWATTDEQNTKYNLAMASGDMPDYLETVPPTVFVKMVEANLLEDITDAFEMYASPRWQDTWAEYGDLPWTYCSVDGRKYGLPRVEDLAHNDNILWYRQDWFDQLGLEAPKTHDELYAVAKAIVDADIGKGAAGTTIGMLANMDYEHTWLGSLDPIWAPYGVVPDHWSDVDGALVFDGIREEMKEPLALLAEWYKDGIFRQDFFTLNTSDSAQDLAASRCGIHFTPSWGAWLDTVQNDPDTVWAFTDNPAGANGVVARHTENNFREEPFCFRSGFEHVDQIFTITNWMQELTEDYDRRFHGWNDNDYVWQGDQVLAGDHGWSAMAIGPIGTRGSGMIDPHHIGNLYKYQLDVWGAIPEDQRDAYMNLQLSDPTGVQILNKQSRIFILDTADEGKITKFQSLPTPTMVERQVDLEKLRDETVFGIITGQKPLDDFDAYVEQWKALGGDKITGEVNEWWSSQA